MNDVILYLTLFVVAALTIKIIFKKLFFKKIETKEDWEAFSLREELMNKSERTFFEILQKELGSKFLIFSKVRIEDFIGVDKRGLEYSERQGNRNKIKSYHVDFLICEKFTTKPLMVIELDGSSHERLDRKSRDERFDKLYNKIGIDFKHVQVGSNFEKEAGIIKQQLLGE